MKFKVSYYDFDTDKYIKQDFDRINFYSNGEFYLYSLNPYKCHKVVISNSEISFDQDIDRMNMRIMRLNQGQMEQDGISYGGY